MKIKRGWHPIFNFLFELFKDLPPHFKCFRNSKMKLLITINSYVEDQGKMYIVFERQVNPDDWDAINPGELSRIKEEWWLNFKEGSCTCAQETEFKSFTGNAIKTTKGEMGPYPPKRYNDKGWTWIKHQLDFVLKTIKESDRINPYTGKILTLEEARAFDEKMSVCIGRVEDFGVIIGEALQKQK